MAEDHSPSSRTCAKRTGAVMMTVKKSVWRDQWDWRRLTGAQEGSFLSPVQS